MFTKVTVIIPLSCTCSAGFIGSHLVDKLLERSLGKVIIIDNFNDYYSPATKHRNISLLKHRYAQKVYENDFITINGSIGDTELLKQIFQKYSITHIAHLAAMAGVRSSMQQTRTYIDANFVGTQNLLQLAVEYKVELFVFASTSSVYGQTDNVPFIETDACDRPLSAYSASKRSAELLAHVYYNLYGLNISILRLFNVYGPRGRPDMMPYKLMKACYEQQHIIDVYDHGKMKRDWTYIDDVVDGLISSLARPLGYEILNIGYGQPLELNEFIKHIETLSGKTIQKRFQKSTPSEPSITYCDNTKAKKLLDFNPKTNIKDGLAKMWKWFQEEYENGGVKTFESNKG
ncbi:unnamed protein product [Didymodactylos carnosus]|uniref:NAD(P)-binding domain-containing protein n=1 Tax=Didymodactylos carnosus TaxID=1234261 RepID=A0A814FZW9_9BILA|nr:unnamed protein product [Didymodactylos carnosus]CAF3761298.1 unnamed protein product [Didymodactylos carnosus]